MKLNMVANVGWTRVIAVTNLLKKNIKGIYKGFYSSTTVIQPTYLTYMDYPLGSQRKQRLTYSKNESHQQNNKLKTYFFQINQQSAIPNLSSLQRALGLRHGL